MIYSGGEAKGVHFFLVVLVLILQSKGTTCNKGVGAA